MKTKELIKRIELMGYGAEGIKSISEVRIFYNGYECATVYTDEFLSLDTHHFTFYGLGESEQEALYNLLDEY
ncbi:hypothetical protein, partial [Klebsiella pneumoniae]|uniref:hypothetical protein n=1 Tax=Klebsiella pneumoniae TaxID=573 RepID=UPI002731F8AB